jgi:tetratricopeptide (TPR) repeat protein
MALLASSAHAQQQAPAGPLQQAQALDREADFARSRALYQAILDTVSDARAKANVHRRLAMSYGFEGSCAKTIEYEEMVIAYWKTREADEPQNAFYQQGEMANEAARVCIDADALDEAERMYRRGAELGNKEPEPRTHPASLWAYRLEHALARLAARRGNAAEAQRHVAAARAALDGDAAMAKDQDRYFPYLVGYVALYTGDLATAEAELTKATSLNESDPFMLALLGTTFEKQGKAEEAKSLYTKAFDMARGHNPPAAFARRELRKKVGM